MLFNHRLAGKVDKEQMHHAGTANVCSAVVLATERWSKYECTIQEWTRGSPFVSSLPGEHKISCLLNKFSSTTTPPGYPGRLCGPFPVFVCWEKRDQAQSNYGYEPVYFCAPLTSPDSSTASGSQRKATSGQGMARVGSSHVKAFRYSVETHS